MALITNEAGSEYDTENEELQAARKAQLDAYNATRTQAGETPAPTQSDTDTFTAQDAQTGSQFQIQLEDLAGGAAAPGLDDLAGVNLTIYGPVVDGSVLYYDEYGDVWTIAPYPNLTAYALSATVSTQLSNIVEVVTTKTIVARTGSYTLLLTDRAKLITLNSADPVTVTVPPSTDVAFSPVGGSIDLVSLGAGLVTVAAGAGVTVHATPSLVLRAQYSKATLQQLSADVWVLSGDLATP